MNPKRIAPYVEAESIRAEQRDKEMWMMGMYIYRATLASTEQVLAGRKSTVKYLDEPFMATIAREKLQREMSEEEKMRQVNAVFAALNVMAVNRRLGTKERDEVS